MEENNSFIIKNTINKNNIEKITVSVTRVLMAILLMVTLFCYSTRTTKFKVGPIQS